MKEFHILFQTGTKEEKDTVFRRKATKMTTGRMESRKTNARKIRALLKTMEPHMMMLVSRLSISSTV